ncbi:MAG TPA: hypothetical protein VHT70_02775 [Candidatus Saccharimonadales bacterium]|jgi:hypothetical protein|nr:hypothetical protein [Candidatus Saccharimonadales bacterium]
MKIFRHETSPTPEMPDTSGWLQADDGNFSRVRMVDLNDDQWRTYTRVQPHDGPAAAPAHAHDMLRKAILSGVEDEYERAWLDSLVPPLDEITEPTFMQVRHPRLDKSGRPAGSEWGSYTINEAMIHTYADPSEYEPIHEPATDTPIAPVIDLFTGKEL